MTLESATVSATQEPKSFALGLGLTNECNLSCGFCYRDPSRTDRLTFDQVRRTVESVPLRSINLGTGENGMHPEFAAMLAYLRQQPLKLTMTSNGYSVQVLPDEDLEAFDEIEFSLDYPNEKEQDAQRGAGNWALIHQQAARCRSLGVPVTLVAVMMRSNYDRLAEIAAIAKTYDAPLRLNVYQAVRSDTFALTYDEYWTGFELLFGKTDVLAIGEPLVRAMAGLPPRQGGCGVATIRVTPRATVQPCVYWPGQGAALDLLFTVKDEILHTESFEAARSLPGACQSCEYLAACRGGCAGRRRLLGQLAEPDPYCPVIKGEKRALNIRLAEGRNLAKSDSACTTVVIAR
ncbi:MAG: radical SAM/SPASM domain-containing protein [Rhodomicrobium sp.]